MSPKVSVYNKQKHLKIASKSVKEIVKATLEFYTISCDEIAIHFVSTSAISKLHAEFFDDPTTTDCITFPCDEPGSVDCFLGDVFVCPETALQYAKKREDDPYKETTLYVIHGILHLIGYDDLEPEKRRQMKLEEKRVMNHLKRLKALIHS